MDGFMDIIADTDRYLQEQEQKGEERRISQTSNGFYQNFLRLDLLTRTTKGVFPDIVPDEKQLNVS
jgi:hypothetical protein